jgi:flagellar basal body P-ring formation protein FlgA
MRNRSFYRVFFCLICLPLNAASAAENISQLRSSITQFLIEKYQANSATPPKNTTAKVTVNVGGLDPRLNLTQCANSHSLSVQDPNGNGGNVNVQVTCSGLSGWTILVPAQVIVYRSMAIAGRDLPRGTLIVADDLKVEIVDMSQYRQGFSREPNDIIGKELKYPVNKGDSFRTSVLDSPLVIKRGDEVSLEALAGGIQVIAKGTAVSDGRLGQMIRVKNTQSDRILSAKVMGSGKVQSIL